MELPIKRLHADAILPSYAHTGDAGMDIYALEGVTIAPGERALVRTGIAMGIPLGYVGLFWDKSGLATKHGLKTIAGVIDASYRGELMVGLLNTSVVPYSFAPGDKVAQMLIQRVEQPAIIEVLELDDTTRGDGAFGSTGK